MVPLALGLRLATDYPEFDSEIDNRNMNTAMPESSSESRALEAKAESSTTTSTVATAAGSDSICSHGGHLISNFTQETRCVV